MNIALHISLIHASLTDRRQRRSFDSSPSYVYPPPLINAKYFRVANKEAICLELFRNTLREIMAHATHSHVFSAEQRAKPSRAGVVLKHTAGKPRSVGKDFRQHFSPTCFSEASSPNHFLFVASPLQSQKSTFHPLQAPCKAKKALFTRCKPLASISKNGIH